MRKIIPLLLIFFISLFAKDIVLDKGWNLIGTSNEKIYLNSDAKRVFTYEKGEWNTYPKAKNYKYIGEVKPYSGAWFYSDSRNRVNFRVVNEDKLWVNLQKGWNLISGDVNIDELKKDSTVKLIWRYVGDSEGWEYYTNDEKLASTLQSSFSKIENLNETDGIWVYASRAVTISTVKNAQNYFFGKRIDEVNIGYSDGIIVLSDNYPSNSYGKFLKNGNEIDKNDNKIESNDELSFVPSYTTSIAFINLEDLEVDYLPSDGNLTDPNKFNFKIVMPKFSAFSLNCDEKEISGDKIYFDTAGNHTIKVGLKDTNGNLINNYAIFLKVDDQHKKYFTSLQAITSESGYAVFKYNMPELLNENFEATFSFADASGAKIEKSIKIISSSYAINFDLNSLTVDKSLKQYEIAGQLYDKAKNAPAVNTEIEAEYILLQKGKLDNYSTTTDESGYFKFTYTSPKSLDINDFNLTIYNDYTKKSLEVKINKSTKSENIKIEPLANSLTLTNPKESKTIEFYLYKLDDGKALPYENAYVDASFKDKVIGGFDSYKKITDSNGKVVFTYTSPSDIKDLDSSEVRFYLDTNESIDSNITIKFQYKNISSNTKLEITPENITTTSPNDERTIKAVVIDESNKPMPNINISILADLVSGGVDYGTVSKSQITTDENGIATFKYKSPSDIEDLYGKDKKLTLKLEDTNIEKNVTIQYKNPQSASTVKKIIVDPTSFTVNSGIKQTVTIYTFDADDKPVSDSVSIDSLIDSGKIYGEITPNSIKTDENGKATITYTPPSNIDDFSGKEYKVAIKSSNNIETNLTIKFMEKAQIDKLIMSPRNISVVEGLTQDIKILTLSSNNKPLSAIVKVPQLIDEDGETLLGTFDTYSVVTDDKGEATIKYTAPLDISEINGEKNVTISAKDSSAKSTLYLDFNNTTYSKNSYELKLVLPNYVEITGDDNVVMDIVKKNNEDSYIESENVKSVTVEAENGLIYFDSNFTKKDYSYDKNARKSIEIYSKYNSGIEIFRVKAVIFDGEENVTLTKEFPLTVYSGPVSAISMVFKETKFDAPFFEDIFTLHAVDKYGNPAKAGTKIDVGVISGVRKGGNGNYLKVDENGTLSFTDNNITEFNLTDSTHNFSTVQDKVNNDEGSDTLIVLANEKRYSPLYLGGWIIEETYDNNVSLKLDGYFDYNNTKADKLSFVIGNEKVYNGCEETYNVADFDNEGRTYMLDENGNATLVLKYDPYFVGHDLFLYANSIENNKRVGVSLKRKLWGKNIDSTTFVCDGENSDTNCTNSISFSVKEYGGALRKVKFYLDNFKTEEYKTAGSNKVPCNSPTITILNADSGCIGKISIKIEVPKGNACKVLWNNSLHYEY